MMCIDHLYQRKRCMAVFIRADSDDSDYKGGGFSNVWILENQCLPNCPSTSEDGRMTEVQLRPHTR